MRNMRLGVEAEPINLDQRNNILAEIAAGRAVQTDVNTRMLSIPMGQPTPFGPDQTAFEAAFKGFQETEPGVTALYTRLSGSQGPYWRDLTSQEGSALALWSESIRQMNSISAKYFPTPTEMDVKKLILLAIGVGAIFGTLLFTEDKPGSSIFSLFPRPSSLLPPGVERAPRGLPVPAMAPMRPGLTYGGSQVTTSPIPAATARTASALPNVARQGYVPSRFSRGFEGGSREPASAGAIAHRPQGQRFVYPKPR